MALISNICPATHLLLPVITLAIHPASALRKIEFQAYPPLFPKYVEEWVWLIKLRFLCHVRMPAQLFVHSWSMRLQAQNIPLFCFSSGHTIREVVKVSYINPAIRYQFETLSIDLKNEILSRDVTLTNMNDLITVLEQIVSESESPSE